MSASATPSSSTTQNRVAPTDRLALIRAKAEREALKAKLSAKAEAEDADALATCHTILDRMSIRGAKARALRERQATATPRKRSRLARPAPITARDVEIEVGTASVQNPYDPSTFIAATVNRRVDVLSAERGQGHITEAQFLVGRNLQTMWEKQLGIRSSNPAWDSITASAGFASRNTTHGLAIEDIRMLGRLETARAVKAANDRAARVIGEAGVRFLRAILAEGHSFKSYAEARGRAADWRAISDITRRFRWLLEELTEAYHTARAPGAAPIQDEYAAQANEVAERLLRSAALTAEQVEAEEDLDPEIYTE
ncbi:hypothetical protein [Methylorubrum extorquens]|uniref:hypothetical protein n=1 Tax=Methylorubrum extorquens TaxID=408 RepID=UPI0020A20DA3|nr:hypothetical protein [Methylorubrum extorquens]MCP1540147.1 hypothetical protein [Methylorubrum extorquens]